MGVNKEDKWADIGRRQEEFAVAFGRLLLFASQAGIPVRVKDAYRDERAHGKWGEKKGYGAAFSLHKLSLAVDLYTSTASNYDILHDYWDSVGGAKRIEGDGNHFSFSWQGYR